MEFPATDIVAAVRTARVPRALLVDATQIATASIGDAIGSNLSSSAMSCNRVGTVSLESIMVRSTQRRRGVNEQDSVCMGSALAVVEPRPCSMPPVRAHTPTLAEKHSA